MNYLSSWTELPKKVTGKSDKNVTFFKTIRQNENSSINATNNIKMKNEVETIKLSEYFIILVDSVSPPTTGMTTSDGLVAFSMKRFRTDQNQHYPIFTQNEIDMKNVQSIVTAEFNSCEDAIEAIDLLIENGLEEHNISIIGKYKFLEALIEDEYELAEVNKNNIPLASLNNFGTIDLPTIDTVFVAGALMGKHRINGTIVSLASNNLESILKNWGFGNALIKRYLDYIANNKTLILALGEATEINRASSTLKYDTMAKAVDLFAKKQTPLLDDYLTIDDSLGGLEEAF